MTGKQFPCKYGCGTQVTWPKPYVQGAPPVNIDGTKHDCPNFKAAGTPFAKPTVAAPAPTLTPPSSPRIPRGEDDGGAAGRGNSQGGTAAGTTDKQADGLLREMAVSLARIAMNSNDILTALERIEKLLGPHQTDMDLYPSDPAGGSR